MDLDYQLKKYWTFFSNRCFNEGERVHFFCDGSFAIYNSTKIQYYDSDCNATDIILGNDLRILASGITISVGNDRISVLRSGINKCSEIIISKKAGSSVLNSASLVLITNQNTNLAEIYKIEASYKPLVAKISQINVELPYDKIYKIESSLDSNIFAIDFEIKPYSLPPYQKLYTLKLGANKAYDITQESFERLYVMECGSYIVKYKNYCRLYSPSGDLILASKDPGGIINIGYNHVRFDDELIVNAITGKVIGKHDAEISKVTRDNIMIGRYYAKDGNGKIGYLLDCKLLPSRCGNLLSNDLSVFYQQGTFYPVTFDSLNNLYLNGVPYYERLQAMKLR